MEAVSKNVKTLTKEKRYLFMRRLRRQKWFLMMLTPGLIYFLIYKYLPMWGILIAFQDYQPFEGVFRSNWVGFKHFQQFSVTRCSGYCFAIRWSWLSTILFSFRYLLSSHLC